MIRHASLWIARLAMAVALSAGSVHAQTGKDIVSPTTSATLHADAPGPVVDRHIFSQFAEHLGYGIYGGIWVGPTSKIPNIHGYRKDVVEALRALHVPLVRWPGGCFADEYHWRDGIGAHRPTRINTHWGGVTEPNSFGTHEFMDFAELIGAETYVSGNVGSDAPAALEEWVQYITAPEGTLAQERAKNGRKAPWKLDYVGIGNELWGCGGNMRADDAAAVTRRYATFVKPPFGMKVQKIASGANGADTTWTEVMMREAGRQIDGIGLHYYTVPGEAAGKGRGSATAFTEVDYARTMAKTWRMEELLTKHSAIMDTYDPARRVNLAVDEWGIWTDVEPGTNPGFLYQQNSLRDALLAAVNINIFVHHAQRVRMTNIAQMVNVLQAMILTDGPRMVLTPTYHVFDMYRPFQDGTALPLDLPRTWYNREEWTAPAVTGSAVRGKDGAVHVALANIDPGQGHHLDIALAGMSAASVSGRVLTAGRVQDVNDFGAPARVVPVAFGGATIRDGALSVDLPPRAVVVLDLR